MTEQPDADEYEEPIAAIARRELRARPALLAVAVELVLVLILGNQWMFDHVVTPWSLSASPEQRGLASAISWFSWLFTPQPGFFWLWLAQVLHQVVWLVATYFLVRAALRSTDVLGRFVAVAGSVLAAAVVAITVDRLVSYPDVHKLFTAASGVSPPGFVAWTFFGSVGNGAVLAVTVVAVLAASVITAVVSDDGDDEPT